MREQSLILDGQSNVDFGLDLNESVRWKRDEICDEVDQSRNSRWSMLFKTTNRLAKEIILRRPSILIGTWYLTQRTMSRSLSFNYLSLSC